MTRRAPTLLACASLLLSACVAPSDEPAAAPARDSTGVRIVEIERGATVANFSLGDPRVTIGGPDADSAVTLFQVSGGAILGDGRIVIANAGSYELLQFDAEGSFIRTGGGRGGGPGEFQGIDWMRHIFGDSIVTWDWSQSRVQVFDADLRLSRILSPAQASDDSPINVEALDVLPDGGVLGWGPEFAMEYPREPLQGHLYRLNPEGAVADSIGPFASARRVWISGETPPPFSRNSAFVVRNGAIYSAISENSDIRISTMDGETVEIVRGGIVSRPPTDAEVEDALEGLRPFGTGEPWVSAELPYWTEFEVDRTGAVWRRLFVGSDAESVQWVIVGPDRSVGVLETSVSFLPLDIGEDWVLAVEKDDFDVERVVVYELERGGR